MKSHSQLPFAKALALGAALLAVAFASLAAQTPTNAAHAGPAHAPTNAVPALAEIPQSVFTMPTSPQEGKDPFFPRSMRLFNNVVVQTNLQATPVVAVELHLNGISGTPDHRLAIINNRTFEAGEEGEVSSASGRVRVTCKDIKLDSVRVLVSGRGANPASARRLLIAP